MHAHNYSDKNAIPWHTGVQYVDVWITPIILILLWIGIPINTLLWQSDNP